MSGVRIAVMQLADLKAIHTGIDDERFCLGFWLFGITQKESSVN